MTNLGLHPQVQGSEEEDGEREGGVGERRVVAAGREEHPHEEAEDHAHVLVHAEGHDVALGQRGVDVHDGGGQVDDEQLQHEQGERGAAGLGQDLGGEPVLEAEHVAHHQDVGHEGHGGDVEVRRVQLEPGLHGLVVVVSDGPVGVREGEHQQGELLRDVRVVNSEIILKRKLDLDKNIHHTFENLLLTVPLRHISPSSPAPPAASAS